MRVSSRRSRPLRPANHSTASSISAATTIAMMTPVSIPFPPLFVPGRPTRFEQQVSLLRSRLLFLFLEFALQNLARRVARKLVDEDDLARHLVARQVLLHV